MFQLQTFLSLAIGAFLWIYFLLVAANAGSLQEVKDAHEEVMDARYPTYAYVGNGVIAFTVLLSCLTALWMFNFIVDCQHMIIAGSVARWFFTRYDLSI